MPQVPFVEFFPGIPLENESAGRVEQQQPEDVGNETRGQQHHTGSENDQRIQHLLGRHDALIQS